MSLWNKHVFYSLVSDTWSSSESQCVNITRRDKGDDEDEAVVKSSSGRDELNA